MHIKDYQVGDIIYRRVDPSKFLNPFLEVTLTDLSHNIGTTCGIEISEPDDVLYNISPKIEEEKITSKVPCTLEIKSLNEHHKYDKSFTDDVSKGEDEYDVARMQLLHRPEYCMYPHCVFEIRLNGEEVTFENYKQTLGSKKLGTLRTKLREELASMIRRNAIEQKPS